MRSPITTLNANCRPLVNLYNQLTRNHMTTESMNALEYAAYVRLALFCLMGGCAIITASLWLSVYFDWRKSNRK